MTTALVSLVKCPEYEIFVEIVGERNYIHTDIRVWNRQVYKELKLVMELYIENTDDTVIYAAILNPFVAKLALKFGFTPTGDKLDMKHREDNSAYTADIYEKEI